VASSPERPGGSSAKLARAVAVNAAALIICSYVFSGFEIPSLVAYLAAAASIELPTIVWLIAVHFWVANMFEGQIVRWPIGARRIWVAAFQTLFIAIPLVLATSAPGLAFAAWITSLNITGVWTFIGASAITAALTIALGASTPLKFISKFLSSFGTDEQRLKSEEADRAFREAARDLGPALRDALLHWWYVHRTAIRWTLRALRIAALIAGTVTVGVVFGLGLALIVWLVPEATLRLLLRSKRADQRAGVTPEGP
jgi:hypothetical protein